ncbi:Chloroperoxidase [Plasmopara halstedii]|uniref:Chloroperoxidase n=1 Tax=Plasmopara halstedii TaxID=4781 RepID=A0A0P1A4F4_PLAHL|nr:Chloroperoxidase [Plasmopara halstedii]CEG35154.1 Chloroperoxidase [Plasmopara halstedii]|eukprot:XP_024571523.1 Chloroperoxidase [Plasmopara halstedii]
MLSILPDFVTLNTLSRLEHQISLSRPPTYYGHDPAAVNTTLVKSLLLRAKNGFLDAEGVGKAYKARLTEYQSDPRFSVTDSHLTQAFTEGSFLLLIFGANRDDRISVEDARSFLVDEKFPDNWKPSPTPVTLGEARAIAKDIRGFAT